MKITKEQAALIDRNEVSSGQLTEEQEIYKENIIDHYKHPHNKHEMKDADFNKRELNPLCGDEVTLYFKVKNGVIEELSFSGKGCAISQASISMLTDHVNGMKITDARKLSRDDIMKMLGIPISVVRMKCALLSLKTLLNGLNDYEGAK